MVGKQKQPTAPERRRIKRMLELGCICCRLHHGISQPAEVHHLVEGYRLGHRYTIPLCPWHHRGQHPLGNLARDTLGPSLALHKREFIEQYGNERFLLRLVDEKLGYD